ncbi:MAG: TonB-dependent receptor, partial [Cyanobacteria bacterium P01_A01_bin.135]
ADTLLSGAAEIPEADIDAAGTLDIEANLGEPDISRTETSIIRAGYRFEHEFSDAWKIRNELLASFQDIPEDASVVGVGFVQELGQPQLGQLNRIYIDNPSYRESLISNTNVVGNFDVAGIDQTLLLGIEVAREEQRDEIVQRLFLPFLSNLDQFQIFDPNYDSQRFFDDTDPDINERIGSDSFSRTRTIGLYGQSQLNLSDNVILLLGGRIDFARQRFQDLANRETTELLESSETVFSPRVGLVFKPAENVSLYASYTESFNPVIGVGEEGEVFSSERGNQFETGIKADLLGDRLSVTLAYYRLRRTNVLTEDPVNPGFQVQVGEQGSDGVELDIAGELLPGWNVIASYAYTDARIIEDNEFPVGRRLINVPENAASLWSSYEIQGGDLAGLGFGIGLFFQGERNGDIRTPFTLPDYLRTDAALFYRRDSFRAQVNFQNLFDVRYFEGSRDQFRVNPGLPFTVLGNVSWEF